ncbi:MAG: hypothetical protein ACK4IB_07880 [Erythrobacter sp.]
MTQFLSAVEVRELGAKVGSLASKGETVLGALDFLRWGSENIEHFTKNLVPSEQKLT